MNKCTDLIVAFDRGDDCRTQASRNADAESPDHTANEEIPDHVRLSPSSCVQASQRIRRRCQKNLRLSPRGNEDSNNNRGNDHDAPKHHEPYSKEHLLKLSYLADRFFRGSIESDDGRAKLERRARSTLRRRFFFQNDDVPHTEHIPTSRKM